MQTHRRTLPVPSKDHATCAWCHEQFETIVDLIDHVDTSHLPQVSRPPQLVAA